MSPSSRFTAMILMIMFIFKLMLMITMCIFKMVLMIMFKMTMMTMFIFKLTMMTMCMQQSQWEVWAKGRAEVISMIDWTPCLWGGLHFPITIILILPGLLSSTLLSTSCQGSTYLFLYICYPRVQSDSSELSLWVGLFPQWTLMISLDGPIWLSGKIANIWKVIWSSGAGAFLNSCSTHNLLSAFTARG